ncbi:kinesin-like protein KIF12 isoform X2 [Periplaneta americana]|uniref:kinesin-like protein KIF12 isoform X2 n=1 Tax=Periplaneta americana TaxID=6978 RepID=UPI0037E73A04
MPSDAGLHKRSGGSFRSPGANRKSRSSPAKNGTGARRSRGNSPANSDKFTGTTTLPRSSGSENSIVDRWENSNQVPVRNHAPTPEDNINVVVRVRPLNKKEIKSGDESILQFPGNGQIMLGPVGSAHPKPRVFSYNVVFEPGATQDDVLQYSGIKRLIEMAVEGFSTTAFCYGQTGSGKTHTLTGPPGLFEKNPDPFSQDHGLVFRSFMYLFQLLQERSDFHFVLKASFLEIYNEKVIDLLNPGSARKPLAVRWSKKSRGFFVENLFTVDCEELDDLLAVLEEGMRNRSVGKHNMNDYSSRSHTILTVRITSEQQMGEDGVFISKQGKINFVDLAGSEMTKKTNSEGKTLEEANNINKSLMVLGYCIASLSDPRKKAGHIPYRDSKLTKLLADSLAGNGVTLMIACISPARSNVSETLNTLRYAARAKKIRTKPIVVMDPREALILSLKREVNALQNENDHLRSAINLSQRPPGTAGSDPGTGSFMQNRLILKTPPAVDLEKLADMEGQDLVELVRHYITENEALRRENGELFTTREMLLRDQELVCRENERLLKKLEDVNLSPIIPAKPTYSADMLNTSFNGNLDSTNVWVNTLNGSLSNTFGATTGSLLAGLQLKNDTTEGRNSAKPFRLPESIQKEMDKRSIGNSMTNIAESYREKSHRRHNSSDNNKVSRGSTGSADSTSSANRNRIKELIDNQNQDGNQDIMQRLSTARNGNVSRNSPLPEQGSQRRASSLSRITGLAGDEQVPAQPRGMMAA